VPTKHTDKNENIACFPQKIGKKPMWCLHTQQEEARARAADEQQANKKATQLLNIEKERREALTRGGSRRRSLGSEGGRDEQAPTTLRSQRLRGSAALKERPKQWLPAGPGHSVDVSKGKALGLPSGSLHT
jgi:hypothetical protein